MQLSIYMPDKSRPMQSLPILKKLHDHTYLEQISQEQ